MPNLAPEVLRTLLDRAETSSANCVLASNEGGEAEPLCAVYHRRCLPAVKQAISDKRLKMKDLAKEIGAEIVPIPGAALANVNTPADWNALPGQPA
jgi:molybdopterin-guanine dinucleotide biosynthesis protein A